MRAMADKSAITMNVIHTKTGVIGQLDSIMTAHGRRIKLDLEHQERLPEGSNIYTET